MTPEITAIIPTHNRAGLLATTLRTVLCQEEVSLEVIVVDDGSTHPEDTAAAVDALGDPRVRLIRHETPQGVCAARNHGAQEARGPWLAFCDDDDLWAPDKLTLQLNAASDTDRTWAYGGAVHVNADLRLLTAKPPPSPEDLMAALPGWSRVPGGSSNVIVHASTFEAAGRWDPTLINLADWDLWARLAEQGPPACVDSPLVGYRIHPGNASGDVGLILREARILDERFGGTLDYGELHHYLAWVCVRSGRSRAALRQFARAAAHGRVRDAARSLVGLARQRVARRVPALRPTPEPLHRRWLAETEPWVASLRPGQKGAA